MSSEQIIGVVLVGGTWLLFSVSAIWLNLTNVVGQYQNGKKQGDTYWDGQTINTSSRAYFIFTFVTILALIPPLNFAIVGMLSCDRRNERSRGRVVVKQWLSNNDEIFLAFIPVLALGLIGFLL